MIGAGLALAFLALLAAVAWSAYRAGRRANWAAGERIIAHLLDELELRDAAEQEWLREHTLTDDERDTLQRMH